MRSSQNWGGVLGFVNNDPGTPPQFWDLRPRWVPLTGVNPGWGEKFERPTSEFTSVGGWRHITTAKRGMREWNLSITYATPEAVAALEAAATWQGTVLLYDETMGAANMLDPGSTRGTLGGGQFLMVDGVPMHYLGIGTTGDPLPPLPGRNYYSLPVQWLGPVGTYTLRGWTHPVTPQGMPLLWLNSSSAEAGDPADVLTPAPGQPFEHTFTLDPVAGPFSLEIALATGYVTGLQLVAGDPSEMPATWMNGARTPCGAAVSDPDRTQGFTNRCGAGHLSTDDWEFTVREVGL